MQQKPILFTGLTILGTDTEVGKTYVACRIIESLVCQGVAVGAYKPVASGAPSVEQSDGFLLWQASGRRGTLEQVNPQRFLAPLAPPLSAEKEGKQVSEKLILEGAWNWTHHCELLVLEGAGGLMSPISWGMTNADLALEMKFPIALVSENRLGVVNQVLTTLIAARSMGLKVCWVILNELSAVNDDLQNTNERLLKHFIQRDPNPPKIVRIARGAMEFSSQVDWQTCLFSDELT